MRRYAATRDPRLLMIAVLVLVVGCTGNGGDGRSSATVPGSGQTPAPTATPTHEEGTAEPTLPPALEDLLAPGPTYPGPLRIFFRNGDNLWQVTSDVGAGRVTRDLEIGPFAPAPDGSRVAVVVYARVDGQEMYEVRILGGAGETQAVALDARPADPAVVGLAWSWDGSWLAIAWDDGSFGMAPAGPAVGPTLPFGDVLAGRSIVRLEWAPNDAGLVWLAGADAARVLGVTPRSGESILIGGPGAPGVRSFAWLPGRGRIAYVEGRPDLTGPPSSIYTILPDGTARELLVSSGRFGPVAYIDDLSASPDGSRLAFTVFMPGADGAAAFASLWVLSIDTGELEQVETPPGCRVTDLWWLNIGLVWRGVDLAAGAWQGASEYAGDEPFLIGIYSFDSRTSSIVFRSSADE